jgi:hypothetical protein
MFNKTIIQPTKYIPTEVHHHEHKAPTDESVRLLNEMQEKALSNTMLLFRVSNSHVDAVIRVVDEVGNMQKIALIKYSINGCDYEDRIELSGMSLKSKNEIQDYLVEEWRKIVTSVVMKATKNIIIKDLM